VVHGADKAARAALLLAAPAFAFETGDGIAGLVGIRAPEAAATGGVAALAVAVAELLLPSLAAGILLALLLALLVLLLGLGGGLYLDGLAGGRVGRLLRLACLLAVEGLVFALAAATAAALGLAHAVRGGLGGKLDVSVLLVSRGAQLLARLHLGYILV